MPRPSISLLNGTSELPRKQEPAKKFYRSERTVFINDRWYYQSRENAPEGPFSTREDAEYAVQRYLEVVNSPMFQDEELERINSLSV